MPDARDLLRRWSALKSGAGAEEPEAAPPQGEPEGKPEDLPPIDELGPDSDYTAFMRRGVPTALRRAALRRAWSATPAIAGHKPLVDYDWDFHAPGYGQLRPGDDPARIVAALLAPARARRDAALLASTRAQDENAPAPPESQEATEEPAADGFVGSGADTETAEPGDPGGVDGAQA